MQKRSSTNKGRTPNVNRVAESIVNLATGNPINQDPPVQPEKNPAAVALGKLGGLKGGRARAEKLSAQRRSEIALKAAKARWGDSDDKD